MFKVMKERCAECLYGPDKIVSNARRKQLLNELECKDSHFICHKATMVGKDVCCRGDWEQRGGGKVGRFADWLQMVEFVDEESLVRRDAP
jgi:hypothetical protein